MDDEPGHRLLVEVVYAEPRKQKQVQLQVEPGTTARAAALRSGLDAEFSGLDLAHVPVGIFGVRVADDHVLRAGDRVELYRQLPTDPREARRQAAAAGRTLGSRDA
jgi:putative ubiquitin-RnfH superfamily antitoxin RatB of RatAB toxin-antitoxin module